MSRYTVKTKKDDKEYVVAYGFDRPLGEYFIQVYAPQEVNIDDDEFEEDEIIVWEGSRMTGKKNSEMCDLYVHWGVPKEHINMVALDLPF